MTACAVLKFPISTLGSLSVLPIAPIISAVYPQIVLIVSRLLVATCLRAGREVRA